jgi:hypothetical protein
VIVFKQSRPRGGAAGRVLNYINLIDFQQFGKTYRSPGDDLSPAGRKFGQIRTLSLASSAGRRPETLSWHDPRPE